jgi:Na+-translocating ferredoxin:NAD+ oxidoreductase RnfD subunit
VNFRELWNWWWRDPRHLVGLVLLVYAIVAGATIGYATALSHYAVGVVVGGLADLLYVRFRAKRWAIPSSGLVSGSIVGIMTAFQSPLWLVAVIALLAILSKFITWQGKHVFNPANFGMLLGIWFLGAQMDWWGATSLIAVLIGGIIVLWRMRRWWIAVPFLIVFFGLRAIYYASQGDVTSVLVEITASSAVFFFTTIMLIEPKTSPLNRKRQVVYAIIAAVLAFWFTFIPRSGDFHLALALANLSVPFLNRFLH